MVDVIGGGFAEHGSEGSSDLSSVATAPFQKASDPGDAGASSTVRTIRSHEKVAVQSPSRGSVVSSTAAVHGRDASRTRRTSHGSSTWRKDSAPASRLSRYLPGPSHSDP